MSKFILVFFLLLVPILIFGQTFNTQTVTSGNINSNRSISYGPSGEPYILFHNQYSLHLSFWNGGSWQTNHIGGTWSNIKIFRTDTCFYYVGSSGSYIYFHRLSFAGIATQLGNFGPVGEWSACLANDKINILIAYHNGGLYFRKFNLLTHSASTAEIADGLSSSGTQSDITQGTDNRIWISYKEYNNQDIRMARSKHSGGWDWWYVETTGDVGNYSQIAIDASNVAHITYYDATNRRLKYATFNP
ncbi:MAG: hypothetical protein Q8K98_06100 [Bacteroidota bacterium]|nr:hypothetical protein [Bacteroidota bacterium]